MTDASEPEDAILARLPAFRRRLEKTRTIIRDALARMNRPYVAFSGGKDSLVTLALVAEQYPGVTAIWSDDELEYPEQDTYVPAACDALGVQSERWLGHATHAGWFRPWATPPYWREPAPGAVRPDKPIEIASYEHGYDGVFTGLRASERPHRRIHLAAHGVLNQVASGQWRCAPLAWWTVADVWAAIHALRLPVNPVYDTLAGLGLPREAQRVGPLPLTPGWVLKAGWPALYRQLIARYGPHEGWTA